MKDNENVQMNELENSIPSKVHSIDADMLFIGKQFKGFELSGVMSSLGNTCMRNSRHKSRLSSMSSMPSTPPTSPQPRDLLKHMKSLRWNKVVNSRETRIVPLSETCLKSDDVGIKAMDENNHVPESLSSNSFAIQSRVLWDDTIGNCELQNNTEKDNVNNSLDNSEDSKPIYFLENLHGGHVEINQGMQQNFTPNPEDFSECITIDYSNSERKRKSNSCLGELQNANCSKVAKLDCSTLSHSLRTPLFSWY